MVDALAAELATAKGASPLLDRATDALLARFADATDGGADEIGARRLAQDVALAVQASLLHRHAPEFVFDGFCRSRLSGAGPQVFGSLPSNVDSHAILQRALPT